MDTNIILHILTGLVFVSSIIAASLCTKIAQKMLGKYSDTCFERMLSYRKNYNCHNTIVTLLDCFMSII